MSLPHARRTRYRLLAWVVSLCFLAVISRLVWLHWVDAPRLRAEAFQARRVLQEKPCRRGEIRDAQDNLLAVSEDVWDIGVDPDALIKGERERAPEVALILGQPLPKVRLAFETTTRTDDAGEEKTIRWAVLAREVNEEMVKRIKALGIKALRAELKYRRNYPKGQLAAHVLGYVNKEGTPASGIESVMNPLLVGQNGWIESERDGRHREIASNRLREVAEKLGTVSYMVDSAEELQAQWFEGRPRVGLTAGASAPDVLVQAVISRLRAMGAVSVRTMDGVLETIKFPLPKGLKLDTEPSP
jgi:cell division protein FtsI (penicillin-binding protein 3)/stage V sporulation protein D (sporulation-specific penicillin-binding protein)